jgi:hypothetical protein
VALIWHVEYFGYHTRLNIEPFLLKGEKGFFDIYLNATKTIGSSVRNMNGNLRRNTTGLFNSFIRSCRILHNGFWAKCQMQAQEWDEQITRLEKQLHVLHEAKEEALRLLEQLGQRSERLFAMKQEAEEATIYPLYPQGLQEPGGHSSPTRHTWSPKPAKDRPSTRSLSPPPSRTPPPPSIRDPVYVSSTFFC